MTAGPIVILAGGTGGHVFPALAVAKALRAKSFEVIWMGTRRGLETRVVPAAAIPLEWISVSGLRGKSWLDWILAPFKLSYAIVQAVAVLLRRRPSAVLGMGGFVTGPGGIAAWLLRKPLIIHEQNAVAGLTNRILARFSRSVLQAFPGSFPERVPAVTVGNPVREEIQRLESSATRLSTRQGRVRILVMGGSQGALKLNEIVPRALARMNPEIRPEVWHQAGPRTLDVAQKAYREAEVEARVDAFIEQMQDAYLWADLVVCRAGALTISELASVGLGAILVPYPAAVDDHQTKNAAFLVSEDAAIVIADRDLTPERLDRELTPLLENRDLLRGMALNAERLAAPNAVADLTRACLDASGVTA